MALTPQPFDGDWYYSAKEDHIIQEILTTGVWHPCRNEASIYGTAVYLARCNWYGKSAAETIIVCRLNLLPNEVRDSFDGSYLRKELGVGNTAAHLRGYLQSEGLMRMKNTVSGAHPDNQARREFFLNRGIKAVYFLEYAGMPVVAVYDPTVIVDLAGIRRDKVPDCPVGII